MLFSEGRSVKRDRRIRNGNSTGIVLDTINFILGIGVILSAFVVFIDHEKNQRFFTVVFILSALMNICMGYKYFKRHEVIKTAALMIAGVLLIVMSVITFMAFWY